MRLEHLLDAGGDMEGLDARNIGERSCLTPVRESNDGFVIGDTGILVADGAGEEIPEALLQSLGRSEQRRDAFRNYCQFRVLLKGNYPGVFIHGQQNE